MLLRGGGFTACLLRAQLCLMGASPCCRWQKGLGFRRHTPLVESPGTYGGGTSAVPSLRRAPPADLECLVSADGQAGVSQGPASFEVVYTSRGARRAQPLCSGAPQGWASAPVREESRLHHGASCALSPCTLGSVLLKLPLEQLGSTAPPHSYAP